MRPIGVHLRDDNANLPLIRVLGGTIATVTRAIHHLAGKGGQHGATIPKAGVVFFLPQGLTVTGVNTWALSAVRALRKCGRPAWVVIHGAARGYGDIAAAYSDHVIRLDLPQAEMIQNDDDVSEWGRAYEQACREVAGQASGALMTVPTRHDACFAACVWAAQRFDSLRVALWQQLDSRYEDALLNHFEPGASVLVGASAHLERSLSERFPHRRCSIERIVNAVEIFSEIREAPPLEQRPIRLVYTGRMVLEQKRVLALVRMSDDLSRRGIEHELRLVGDGPALPMLQTLAAERPAVSLTGAVDANGVRDALKWADAFVLASEREGLSFSLLEAMAHGRAPILTRTRSGSDEAVEHGVSGWVVESDDGDDLVGEALATGVADAMQAGIRGLGRLARRRVVDLFSIEHHAAALSALCERVALEAPPRWPAGRQWLARGTNEKDAEVVSRAISVFVGHPQRRFVVHGAGGHTRRIAVAIDTCRGSVVAIADDEPSAWGGECLGMEVIDPAQAASYGATDVLISSDLHEDAIWQRRSVYEQQGLRVHRLYSNDDGE